MGATLLRRIPIILVEDTATRIAQHASVMLLDTRLDSVFWSNRTQSFAIGRGHTTWSSHVESDVRAFTERDGHQSLIANH